jgi:hypothetical protein
MCPQLDSNARALSLRNIVKKPSWNRYVFSRVPEEERLCPSPSCYCSWLLY